MTLEKLKLTVNGTDSYVISMIETVDLRSSKDAFSIAPPGLAASENILLGISGMNADITVNFRIHDDGTDKSDGTAPTSITSIEDQIRWLEDTIQDPAFDATWELDHLTGNAFENDEVFFEELSTTPISRESPRWRQATISLRRGGSV
jgi:hypothetical protein